VRSTRGLAALLLVVGILITFAPATDAVPPDRFTTLMEGRFVIAKCLGFDVVDQFFIDVDTTLFFDQDGNVTEVHLMIRGTDSYVNTVTGRTITMPSSFMVHFDPETLLNMSTGLQYRLQMPGLGNILLDVGRTVFDLNTGEFLVLDGPHQVAEGDTSGICLGLQ
jgi:hypothetical protein